MLVCFRNLLYISSVLNGLFHFRSSLGYVLIISSSPKSAVSFLADVGGLYCFSIGLFFYILVQVHSYFHFFCFYYMDFICKLSYMDLFACIHPVSGVCYYPLTCIFCRFLVCHYPLNVHLLSILSIL